MKKRNKKPWFKQIRGSYIPVSWQGGVSYVPMVAFMVTVLIFSVQNAESIAGGLYYMFPYFVCTAVVMHWFAKLKS